MGIYIYTYIPVHSYMRRVDGSVHHHSQTVCQTGLSSHLLFLTSGHSNALWRSELSVRVPRCQKLKMTA